MITKHYIVTLKLRDSDGISGPAIDGTTIELDTFVELDQSTIDSGTGVATFTLKTSAFSIPTIERNISQILSDRFLSSRKDKQSFGVQIDAFEFSASFETKTLTVTASGRFARDFNEIEITDAKAITRDPFVYIFVRETFLEGTGHLATRVPVFSNYASP